MADLGRWLLENQGLKSDWGRDFWQQAFDGCGSPSEWADFQGCYSADPRLGVLLEQLAQIDEQNQMAPRSRIRQPVELSSLDF